MYLGNGCETDNGATSVSGQHILNKQEYTTAAREQVRKYVPAATDTHATEERCFLRGLCRDIISKGKG
jgi:hypothetical protein